MGAGFNQDTGVFTTKHKGVYMFTISALAHNNSGSKYFSLMHNNIQICRAYDNDDVRHNTMSCSATIALNSNDLVYIKLEGGTIRTDEYTIFTGTLIQSLD